MGTDPREHAAPGLIHSRGVRAVERTVRAIRLLPTWQGITILAVLLGTIWGIVALTGGTRTALPHLFYLPIILAAALFGLRGAITVVLAATVLAGPLMPGEAQPTLNWMLRGLMFATVATAVSAAITLRDGWHQDRTRQDLARAMDLKPLTEQEAHPELVRLVPGVLQEGAFRIVYQPIICLRHHRVRAVEALARFDGPVQAPPDRWFRAAHAAGIGPELELSAIEQSLRGCRSLPSQIALAVNISAETLTYPGLRTLLESQTRQVILELTEHDVIGNYSTLNACLADLRSSKVQIAVDDAGAGTSSLRHIVQLRPDVIKLDISLTKGVARSAVLGALGRSVATFAHSTHTLLVVEGIENPEDLDAWRELGADAAQGDLLAPPGTLDGLTHLDVVIPSQRPRPHTPGQPPPSP